MLRIPSRIQGIKEGRSVGFDEVTAVFGEDGNMVAVGLKDSAIFQYQNFEKFRELCLEMKKIPGVTEVISLPLIQGIEKDTAQTKFNLRSIFPDKVTSQEQLDSLLIEAKKHQGFKPVKVTSDLASFSNRTYFEVKKELRIKYSKHVWPDDPWAEQAIRGVKRKQ